MSISHFSETMDDDGDSCSICLDIPTLPVTLPCKHVYCYMCIKQVSQTSESCPMCRAYIPDYVYEGIKVSENDIRLNEVRGKWMYSGRNHGWWYFSPDIDDMIEHEWSKYNEELSNGSHSNHSTFSISILGMQYTIDFINMTQTSLLHNVRKIKREENASETVKGISGIQIVKEEDLPQPSPVERPSSDDYTFNPNVWEDEE